MTPLGRQGRCDSGVADHGVPIAGAKPWLRFLLGFAVIWGALAAIADIDPTPQFGFVIFIVTLLVAIAEERVLFRTSIWAAIGLLGFGLPTGRSLLAGAVISAMVLAVYPLFMLVTGASVTLRPNWVWLSFGLYAYHGLAEELAWRGYAFRRLREGRSFWQAMAWTMPLIAATHVPILLTSGLVVGTGALVVAAVTSLPLGYLWETGCRTIWAPALVHAAIDSFKLVVIPDSGIMTFSMLLVAVSILVPLVALAFPRRFFEQQPREVVPT